MQEDNTPHSQSPMDREASSRELYPIPAKGPLVLSSNSINNPLNKASLPWLKIALLGSLTMAPPAIAMLAASELDGWKILGLLTLGITPLGALIVMIIMLGISVNILRKFGLQYPLHVAATSIFLVTPIIFGLSSFVLQMLPQLIPAQLNGVPWIISGGIGFCLSTYIFEKAKPSTKFIVLGALIIAPLLLLFGLKAALRYAYPASYGTEILAKAVDWRVLPAYPPANMTDISQGKDNTNSCAEVIVSGAYYDCSYSINYPGYLSTRSQEAVNGLPISTRATPEIGPRVDITVTRDNKTLDAYKYHDKNCDISGLESAGAAPRNRKYEVISPPTAKHDNCNKVITPGGKTLYYDSSHFNNTEVYEPIPYNFYFEQNESVVLIRVGSNPPLANTRSAVYYTDSGYQHEIYKFVDSFQ